MTKKVLLGGLVGSIVVFVVSSIWHLAPGLGEIGVKPLPQETSVLASLRGALPDPGLYFFPAPIASSGKTGEQAKADQAAYLEKFRQGPSGILVYHPGGEELQFGKLLIYQFVFGLVGAFLVAWVLALAAGVTTYGSRVLIVLAITLFGGVMYDLPAWNWYGFPMDYTLAHIASWLVSWGAAGLAMAAIVKPPASR